MFRLLCVIFSLMAMKVTLGQNINLPLKSIPIYSGKQLEERLGSLPQNERDSLTLDLFIKGNFPSFLEQLSRVSIHLESADGKIVDAYYYVLIDYLSLGTNEDFIRLPMTPNAAQKLADSIGFYLSNSKICDDIYQNAVVKLEPIPMVDNRTSFDTFVQHNNLIEKQRSGRMGLIAGIKKDVISTAQLEETQSKVAIYGWHKLDGEPIQPIYTKHADYYVDYSHGIRLVYPFLFVDGNKIHFDEILKNEKLRHLISKETSSDYYRYHY